MGLGGVTWAGRMRSSQAANLASISWTRVATIDSLWDGVTAGGGGGSGDLACTMGPPRGILSSFWIFTSSLRRSSISASIRLLAARSSATSWVAVRSSSSLEASSTAATASLRAFWSVPLRPLVTLATLATTAMETEICLCRPWACYA